MAVKASANISIFNVSDGTSVTVKSTSVTYQASSSGTTAPTGTWQSSPSATGVTNGQYLWSRTIVAYSSGTSTTTYSVSYIGTNGSKGDKGDTGNTGQGASAIVQQYYLSTSNTSVTGGSWSTTMTWSSGKYVWTRYQITWTNPSATTYTDAILADAINSANTTANTANNTANTANTNASKAVTTANTANSTANTANNTANAAKTAAATAQTTANNAAKTATNFLEYNSTDGLIVGNKTSGSWSGTRAQIKSDSYNILDSSGNQLASFGTTITLGTRYEGSTVGTGSIAIGDGNVIASGAHSIAVGDEGYIATLNTKMPTSVTTIYYNDDGSSYSVTEIVPRVDSDIYNRGTASGKNSISLGAGNTASGINSCCLGVGNTASGAASFAQGDSNKSSGTGSFAIGELTIASGNYSFCGGSWGYNKKSATNIQSEASDDYSFVFGAGNNSAAPYGVCFGLGNTVIGEGAVALGMYNYVTGIYSLSSGYNTSVSGNYSFASGYETTASGNSSFALGNGAIASGSFSFCGGNYATVDEIKYPNKSIGQSSFVYGAGNEVSGNGSVAFGFRNIIDENSLNSICVGARNAISHESLCSGAVAIGYNNTASGNYAAAIGYNNTASGIGSVAMGCDNTASGVGSVAMGYNVKASHQCSVALCGDTTTSAMYQTVIGAYNKDDSNARFIIGNGTSSARSNAFTVSATGVATAAGGFVGNLTGTASKATADGNGATISSTYLKLSGGTMSGTISSSKVTATYLAGNQGNAIINSTASAGSYTMLAKMNSTNGYFTHGTYQTRYELHYTAASTVTAGTNGVTYNATLLDESGNSTFPGKVTASSFSGSLSGNATTATTLQTARTINGTSFNGSGNITTANWGTARTITIGNKGKSVNGSGNVSWSLSEIGAAAASHTHSYLPLSGGTLTGDLQLKSNALYTTTSSLGINLTLNRQHNTSQDTYIRFYRGANCASYYTVLRAHTNVTANRGINLPNAAGTLSIASSDIRLKENIKDTEIENALDIINQIKMRSFDWNDGSHPHQKIGFVADELERIDDRLSEGGGWDIFTDEDGNKTREMNVKTVDTFYLMGYMVKAMQEMSAEIDELKSQLADLTN